MKSSHQSQWEQRIVIQPNETQEIDVLFLKASILYYRNVKTPIVNVVERLTGVKFARTITVNESIAGFDDILDYF